MSETSRAYFCVLSDDPEPDSVSKLVGREPSSFAPIGVPVSNRPGAVPRKKSVWTIESGIPESGSIEEQLEALFEVLRANSEGVRAAVQTLGAGVNCHMWRETSMPGFHLSAELVQQAAALGVSLDFDIYALEPEESES